MQEFAEIFQMDPFINLDCFLDACLITEDGAKFKVHRLQLALQNRYFKSLFSGNFSEKEDVLIRGIDGNTMGLILRYLYTGYISLNHDNVMDVWIASDYILVESLKEQCKSYVMQEINEENCLGIFLSTWKIEGLGILNECLRYVIVHFGNIVQNCVFPHRKDRKKTTMNLIKELPFESLKKILESRNLNITDEITVLNVIQAWFESDYNERRKYIPELLKCFYLEDKDSQLVTQIQRRLQVQCNRFCDFPTILSPEAKDDHEKCQPYSKGPRTPSSLHFVAQYCMSLNHCYLNLYLTFDNKLDFWRKLATNVALCPDFLIQIGHKVYMFDAWEDKSMAFNMLDCSRESIQPIKTRRMRYKVVSIEHQIYVLGGVTANFEDTDNIERYDPIKDMWYTVTPMHPMILTEVVAMNGCIYAIGDISGAPDPSMVVQVYNPALNLWYAVDPPRHFRHDFTSVVYEGRLYVIGGESLESVVRTVEEYDPERDSWRDLPDLPVAYALPKAIELEDVLIVYENHLEDRRFVSNSPPVLWDVEEENWKIIDESSPMYNVNLYQFCTINQPQILRDLTEANRSRYHEWIKSSLV